eukprot:3627488-Rhodomonas_salina.6
MSKGDYASCYAYVFVPQERRHTGSIESTSLSAGSTMPPNQYQTLYPFHTSRYHNPVPQYHNPISQYDYPHLTPRYPILQYATQYHTPISEPHR